jgi:hypothetical protein
MPPLHIQNALAVEGPRGRVFGTASLLDGPRLSFAAHGALKAGDRVAFRMELAGDFDGVRGELQILEVIPPAHRGPSTFVARLEALPPADAERLAAWAQVQQGAPVDPEGPTPAAHRPETPTELTPLPGGRPSVASALRAGLRLGGGVRAQTARIPLPQVDARVSRDGGTLTLRWSSWGDFAADWARQLVHGTLTLRMAEPPPIGRPLRVLLSLPDHEAHIADGEVLASVRGTITLRVGLGSELRAALADRVA